MTIHLGIPHYMVLKLYWYGVHKNFNFREDASTEWRNGCASSFIVTIHRTMFDKSNYKLETIKTVVEELVLHGYFEHVCSNNEIRITDKGIKEIPKKTTLIKNYYKLKTLVK